MSTSISKSTRRKQRPGRHRLEEGVVRRGTNQVVGATPAQFIAENVIRRNGGDPNIIIVRRAR